MNRLLFLIFFAIASCGDKVGPAKPANGVTKAPPADTTKTSNSNSTSTTKTSPTTGIGPSTTSQAGGGGQESKPAEEEFLLWPEYWFDRFKLRKVSDISFTEIDMIGGKPEIKKFDPKVSEELAKKIFSYKSPHLIKDTWADHVVVASSLDLITKRHGEFLKSSEIGLAFVPIDPKDWNTIPGEVKLINGLRFQFIERTPVPTESYSIVAFSLPKSDAVQNLMSNLMLPLPWQKSDEKPLGEGGMANVSEVEYQGRVIAAKNYKNKTTIKPEIDAYELLLGEPGVGPYLGWVGGHFAREFDGSHWTSGTALLLGLGEMLNDYLDSLPQDNYVKTVEDLFAPLLSTVDRLHNKEIWHCDLKPLNMIMVNNKPHIIDFGNYQQGSGKQIDRWRGITAPYYRDKDDAGPADLRALGLTFFAMKYRKNTDAKWQKYFYKNRNLQENLDSNELAKALESGDKSDQVIAKLISGKFVTANKALSFLQGGN